MSIEPLPQPTVRIPGTHGAAASPNATTFRPLAEALSGPEAPDPVDPNARDEPDSAALEAVQRASRAYEELRAAQRELRFETTESGVRIEVYDGRGELIRTIPPTDVLALAAERRAAWLA